MTVVYSRKRLRAIRTAPIPPPASPPPPPASPPPPSPSAPPPKRRRKLLQLHLDVGQTHAHQQCAVCNMVYTRGMAADEALHKRHHARMMRARDANLSYAAHASDRVIQCGADDAWRIVALGRDDDTPRHKSAAKIDAFVSQLLGTSAALLPYGTCHSLNRRDRPWLALLYVLHDHVVGYVFAEHVTDAMLASVDADGLARVDCRPNGVYKTDVLCGIRKIWVSHALRRQRIATKLLDAARKYIHYAYVVPAHDVAFTATTAAGARLAINYAHRCARSNILVYATEPS